MQLNTQRLCTSVFIGRRWPRIGCCLRATGDREQRRHGPAFLGGAGRSTHYPPSWSLGKPQGSYRRREKSKPGCSRADLFAAPGKSPGGHCGSSGGGGLSAPPLVVLGLPHEGHDASAAAAHVARSVDHGALGNVLPPRLLQQRRAINHLGGMLSQRGPARRVWGEEGKESQREGGRERSGDGQWGPSR